MDYNDPLADYNVTYTSPETPKGLTSTFPIMVSSAFPNLPTSDNLEHSSPINESRVSQPQDQSVIVDESNIVDRNQSTQPGPGGELTSGISLFHILDRHWNPGRRRVTLDESFGGTASGSEDPTGLPIDGDDRGYQPPCDGQTFVHNQLQNPPFFPQLSFLPHNSSNHHMVVSHNSHQRRRSLLDFVTGLSIGIPSEHPSFPPVAPDVPLPPKKVSKWNLVRDSIRRGDFLVAAREPLHKVGHMEDDSTMDTPQQRRRRAMKEAQMEIRNGLTFHLQHILLWGIVYIGVSILAYSVLFEKWSIIDR